MPHANHQQRRAQVTRVEDDGNHGSRLARKRTMLHVCVGFTMLIIVALYVASFAQQGPPVSASDSGGLSQAFRQAGAQLPSVKTKISDLVRLKDQLTAIITAQSVQAKSISIMKAKIESASTTESATTAPTL
jgi:hypothetical protein